MAGCRSGVKKPCDRVVGRGVGLPAFCAVLQKDPFSPVIVPLPLFVSE